MKDAFHDYVDPRTQRGREPEVSTAQKQPRITYAKFQPAKAWCCGCGCRPMTKRPCSSESAMDRSKAMGIPGEGSSLRCRRTAFDRVFTDRRSRGRRVLRRPHPDRLKPRAARSGSPSLRRADLEQAILRIHRQRLARRRSGAADAPRRTAHAAATAIGAVAQSRRDFDARQVGISLVRGLGFGVSPGGHWEESM